MKFKIKGISCHVRSADWRGTVGRGCVERPQTELTYEIVKYELKPQIQCVGNLDQRPCFISILYLYESNLIYIYMNPIIYKYIRIQIDTYLYVSNLIYICESNPYLSGIVKRFISVQSYKSYNN